jgi:hypothetical protein
MRVHHLLAVALAAFVLSAAPGVSQPAPQNFTFGLMGDLGYVPAREPMFENVLADMNAAPLAFSVHVGDLASPRLGCDKAFHAHRLAQFQAMAHPLIFTPGDNEWTDCSDPLDRLADLRAKPLPARSRWAGKPSRSTVRAIAAIRAIPSFARMRGGNTAA